MASYNFFSVCIKYKILLSLSDWFKACQALMAIGLAAGLTAVLVATLGLCCECHSCNPNHPTCGLLVIACEYMIVFL